MSAETRQKALLLLSRAISDLADAVIGVASNNDDLAEEMLTYVTVTVSDVSGLVAELTKEGGQK